MGKINDTFYSATRARNLETVRTVVDDFGRIYAIKQPAYDLVSAASQNYNSSSDRNGCVVGNTLLPSITPLHYAAMCNDEKFAEMLLARMAEIDARDEFGRTPLHYAVQNKQIELVKLFLNRGAYVNVSDQNGIMPLHMISNKYDSHVVMLLLNCGANVNPVCSKGCTPLHYASSRGNEEAVKLLLNAGAHIDVFNQSNFTPLYLATTGNYDTIVELLLQHKANVNIQCGDGDTVLHCAAELGFLRVVENILKFCPDVTNEINRCALKSAIKGYESKYKKIVWRLLKYGFTVNSTDINDCDLLFAACRGGYLEILENLLKYGADVNMKSRRGDTLLHTAIYCEEVEIVKLLISYRANVNAENKMKTTPVLYACQSCRCEVVEILIKHGAKVNSRDGCNRTPLSITAEWGCLRTVKTLLNSGADIDFKDIYGRTALYFASLFNFAEIVEVLLQNGADINIMDNDYSTAMAVARWPGPDNNKTINTLVRHLVRMKTQNLFVNKSDLKLIDTNPNLKQHYNKCEREITKMKNEKISNMDVSFYDIFTEGVHQLAGYARNISIAEALESRDYKKQFPIYADIIHNQFKKGQERDGLLKSFNFLPGNKLPYLCTNKLVSYLSNLDLKNLIEACTDAGGDGT